MALGEFSISVLALQAQANKLQTIAQNVANVNTNGYKRVDTEFSTLVSRGFVNASADSTAAGFSQTSQGDIAGVRPIDRARISQQGQIETSTNPLDVAISGSGFFQVSPDINVNGEIFYTRNGEFQIATATGVTDTVTLPGNTEPSTVNQGFLADRFGNYLLGVPVNADGTFTLGTLAPMRVDQFAFSNAGVATSSASLNINLPSNDPAGTVRNFSAEIVDANLSPQVIGFDFIQTNRNGQWDLQVLPPVGATTSTVNGPDSAVVSSIGQLEFTSRPAQDSSLVINGVTYIFDRRTFSTTSATFNTASGATDPLTITGQNTVTGVAGTFGGLSVGDTIQTSDATNPANDGLTATVTAVAADGSSFTVSGTPFTDVAGDADLVITNSSSGNSFTITNTGSADRITADQNGTFNGLQVGDSLTFTNAETAANNTTATITEIDPNGAFIGFATGSFTVTPAGNPDGSLTATLFNGGAGEALTGTNPIVRVDTSANNTLAQDVASLIARIQTIDPEMAAAGRRVGTGTASTVVQFTEDGTGSISVDASNLLNDSSTNATRQETAFTVAQVSSGFRDVTNFLFTSVPANGDTMTINGIPYTFSNSEPQDADGVNATVALTADGTPTGAALTLGEVLADLERAIEGQDLQYAQGADTVRTLETGVATNGITGINNTLQLTPLSSGAFTVSSTGSFLSAGGTVDQSPALQFNQNATLGTNNVVSVTFNNPGTTTDQTFNLDLSDSTQFAGDFLPGLFSHDGLENSSLVNVSFDSDGTVFANFTDSTRRAIYKVPLATFVNPDGLLQSNGPLFSESTTSGEAVSGFLDDTGVATLLAGAVEGANVDLAQELTRLTQAQAAYNSASTAFTVTDEMLEEAIELKR